MRDRNFLQQLQHLRAQYELQRRARQTELATATDVCEQAAVAQAAAAEEVEAVLADWRGHFAAGDGVDPHAIASLGYQLGARSANQQSAAQKHREAEDDVAQAAQRLALAQARGALAGARLKKMKRRITRRREEKALAGVEALIAFRWVRP